MQSSGCFYRLLDNTSFIVRLVKFSRFFLFINYTHLQAFHNNDINTKKDIKKKKFLKGENIETIKKWTGDDLDMEAEFDDLDEDHQGHVFFEDLVKWALKKNMKIELAKQEEKEKIMAEENGEKEE